MAFPFADVGAENEPDAGGVGSPAPQPQTEPTAPLPSVNAAADLSQNPTYLAALQRVQQRLQPQTPPSGWEGALQKILPMIGAYVAMRNNAGGAFVDAMQRQQTTAQAQSEQQLKNDYGLMNLLRQQAQEAELARRTDANLKIAQQRLDATAAKAASDKRDKLMRDEWTSQSQGGLINTINDVIDNQGPDAADRWMASTNIGSLTEAGVPHTVKDLVDKYAVKGPDGHYIGGKTKTQKEVTAGSKEDYVLRARDLASQTLGRPLSDDEQQQVDEKAIKRYAGLSKDEDSASILKGLQIDAAKLHNELLQQQFDRNLTEKYGSTPIWMQDGQGNPHVYFTKKGENGQPPSLFELKNPGLPPDVSRLQPPSAFQKFLRSIGLGDKAPVVQPIGGGPTDPTDPNWGR